MRVRSVAGSGDLRAFIDLPYRLQGRDPLWVPPLRVAERARLSRARNPFFREAEAEYFVAWAGERAVGRIAAIANRRHDEVYRDGCAFFGFFECEEDGDAARALLDAAGGWARERGYRGIRGPASFSTNHECGLLVEGFHTPPTVMMPHNPPYYAELLRAAGFEKAKDLIAFEGGSPGPLEIPDRSRRAVERLAARSGVRLRAFDARDFKGEVERIKRGYNEAWERNWGFVPMSDLEIEHMASEFRPVYIPDLVPLAFAGERLVGFGLALPDINEILRRNRSGRLLPVLPRLLWAVRRRRLRRMRVLMLGLLPEVRGRGVDAMLWHWIWTRGLDHGFTWGEASWILEDNAPMVNAALRMGFRRYKTYRLLERAA
jgi:GNAT superfamily N-acetyltransferase